MILTNGPVRVECAHSRSPRYSYPTHAHSLSQSHTSSERMAEAQEPPPRAASLSGARRRHVHVIWFHSPPLVLFASSAFRLIILNFLALSLSAFAAPERFGFSWLLRAEMCKVERDTTNSERSLFFLLSERALWSVRRRFAGSELLLSGFSFTCVAYV